VFVLCVVEEGEGHKAEQSRQRDKYGESTKREQEKEFRKNSPPGRYGCLCCECCVLSGRNLCYGLITHPKELYRLWSAKMNFVIKTRTL
jgi:hypothetical protein